MPLYHPSRHCQRKTDTQPCRQCRAATQKPLPRRHHPYRDVTLRVYAATRRARLPSQAASHCILGAPSRAHPWPCFRFHGVLAPHAKLRPAIIPSPPNATDHPAGQGETIAPAAPARIRWAQLLKRVFDIDIEHCPHCGGTLKIIAAILNPTVIAKVLTHLGLSARAPPRSPARRLDLFHAA